MLKNQGESIKEIKFLQLIRLNEEKKEENKELLGKLYQKRDLYALYCFCSSKPVEYNRISVKNILEQLVKNESIKKLQSLNNSFLELELTVENFRKRERDLISQNSELTQQIEDGKMKKRKIASPTIIVPLFELNFMKLDQNGDEVWGTSASMCGRRQIVWISSQFMWNWETEIKEENLCLEDTFCRVEYIHTIANGKNWWYFKKDDGTIMKINLDYVFRFNANWGKCGKWEVDFVLLHKLFRLFERIGVGRTTKVNKLNFKKGIWILKSYIRYLSSFEKIEYENKINLTLREFSKIVKLVKSEDSDKYIDLTLKPKRKKKKKVEKVVVVEVDEDETFQPEIQ